VDGRSDDEALLFNALFVKAVTIWVSKEDLRKYYETKT